VIDKPIIERTQPIQLKSSKAFDGVAHVNEKNTVNIVKCSHVHVTEVLFDK